MKYKILMQFVKADTKFDAQVQTVVKDGIVNYNSRSLMAKNPKQITDYCFSEDNMTLKIILESDEELPMPSKALRLLSTYLVNETFIGEDGYLAGKQLFKMTSSKFENINSNNSVEPLNEKIDDFKRMNRLARYMELLQKADASMLTELDQISEQIEKAINKIK